MRSSRMLLSSTYINPRVKEAQYAVRGLIPTRAGEIQSDLSKNPAKYPFKKMIFCNIGNPQSLQQKPLTFPRQVMSLIDNPTSIQDSGIVGSMPTDVVERAKGILKIIGEETGAYTHSQGYAYARRSVADFIARRDNTPQTPVDPDTIFLTDGASTGVKLVLQCVVGSNTDAVMIPIPQYPLYTATITLLGGAPSMYYLDEASGWSMNVQDLRRAYTEATTAGRTPRVLVVINPGNPTGQLLSADVMADVVKFCHDQNIILMADEVYQENVYAKGKKFVSFREVALSLGAPYSTKTMIASLHSTSKGILGECGRRGGYTELMNFPSELRAEILKLASINLCSNVNGQIMTDLMVSTPKPGDASFDKYQQEYQGIYKSLVARAEHLVQELNTIPGIRSNPIEGAMYAFPSLQLPESFLQYNAQLNQQNGTSIAPDARWCLELLEATGIVVVPGSGFGQRQGTHHFRTTILPPEEDMKYLTAQLRKYQEGFFKKFGGSKL